MTSLELLFGFTTYFLLQLLVYHFTPKDVISIRYGYTNAVSTYIWCFGIMLFLKRLKCNSIQNIENSLIRFPLQIFCIIISLELLLGIWSSIETLVLKWMPDATNHVVNQFFGNGNQKVWQWPFAMLLWIISSYFTHFANNVDRLMDYYFSTDVDSVETQSDVDEGEIMDEESTTLVNGPRHRGKYTLVESATHVQPPSIIRIGRNRNHPGQMREL